MSMLHWDPRGVKIKAFSTVNRGKSTLLRIEIEVTDPWELGDLVRQLQQAQSERPEGRSGTSKEVARDA